MTEQDLDRPIEIEGYGPTILREMIHYYFDAIESPFTCFAAGHAARYIAALTNGER